MPITKKSTFVGRKAELIEMNALLEQRSAGLWVVKGRRRIGKSRLIREFGQQFTYYEFSGLLPNKNTTAQSQRDEFARQLAAQTSMPAVTADDWGKLFQLLGEKIADGRIVVLLDEISWMGSLDPDFVGKLKIAWDLYFKNNPGLVLILCGSVSSWIEKNILGSTGFLGRPTMRMTLEELPLKDCDPFWEQYADKTSDYDKLKLLSVTGGVPRYLELVNPKLSAEDNIKQLCFSPNSILLNEFDYIFTDIFGRRHATYEAIVKRLADGSCSQSQIAEAIARSLSGDITEYLEDLVSAGFVARDYTWRLPTEVVSKLSKYRLRDNYLRFYLKCIQPNKQRIERGDFIEISPASLPGWQALMGLQFENLVLNNAKSIKSRLGVREADVVFDNPFFQRKTNRHRGCQIDYLIQTRMNMLYVCEIKFSKNQLSSEIIGEVKEKISRIALPKHVSYRPVLIHVNGVSESVRDSEYFSDIINFGDLML